MEKFLAEAQTAYFWIVVIGIQIAIGLFVNYSMRPINAVMGRVSNKWKERAEKKWEGLRDQANALNDDELRRHAMWICTAWAQRSIWYLILGITASVATMFEMALETGKQLNLSTVLTYGTALMSGVFALWCLYRALAFDNNVKRVQAALELHEDFRQIMIETGKENLALEAADDAAHAAKQAAE